MVATQMDQAIQSFQQAALAHPLGKAVYNSVQGLQRHHARVFGQQIKRAPRVVALSRPAPFASIIPGDSVGEVVLTTGLLNFLQLYNSAIVVRLVLTWFPNPPAFIAEPLGSITDPYLNLFRGIIPPIGGTLDLSPILAFVALNFFTSTAAALPCELSGEAEPAHGNQQQPKSAGLFGYGQPSQFQQVWQRRVQAQKAARQQQSGSSSV
mmetsp:Transcript_19298/g.33315  ORF Transcript_19298/g.33315 Transcript_19298/m.33315 type:complete len:209 (-) Transcript_19298:538-1164(-)|eukprot:CAMPEP_0119106504 /NCGR_PEP_ID=MMETSP1180-20130426/4497_1 /TAXON_ID=3052 ORGANISM="Chlamydomonas cf sp, Strain CCMP681" /NCGR_SAMPLE_ID=MMETSP1180 /ASSEMBLY_ACC=CAM_ASM_000741 /LENGTH=208 /DNA_ID=CAMNT_0007091861 /DNA_START=77 /DNA_END=703 /DNA_ORIENTATION=+